MKKLNLVGQKFGKLTVLSLSHTLKRTFWKCKCDCGNECIVKASKLKNGQTQSCKCIRNVRNGLAKSKIYNIYKAMLNRCYNEKNAAYKNYGFRGIKVCDKWKNDFFSFLEDMGNPPLEKQLDRIDTNGNYEKSNCRWVSAKENSAIKEVI